MNSLLAVDDGIWQGNFDLADIVFLIATIVFLIAAILPHVRRVDTVDGTRTRVDFVVSLVPLGLALVAFGLLVI